MAGSSATVPPAAGLPPSSFPAAPPILLPPDDQPWSMDTAVQMHLRALHDQGGWVAPPPWGWDGGMELLKSAYFGPWGAALSAAQSAHGRE